jgi:ACT domain-containing protein
VGIKMNAIITVVGSDKVGIIAKVSNFLCEHKINIADITQTILSGNFVMMMMVDLENSDISIDELRKNMENQATEMGVEINIMSERVFSAMHRV